MFGPHVPLHGRSPHVVYRPEQIDVRLDDVVGIEPVKEEVVRSINLFLAHKTFARRDGWHAAARPAVRGPPGTGKTHTAKAMAAEAGVPFLFVSATSFQSMFYGATAAQDPLVLQGAAQDRARRGRRDRLHRGDRRDRRHRARHEHDVARRRRRRSTSPCCGGAASACRRMPAPRPARAGRPTQLSPAAARRRRRQRAARADAVLRRADRHRRSSRARPIDRLNLFLPPHRQLRDAGRRRANILLIAATNRADALDPALLRPGRFDRALTFELPDQNGRRALDRPLPGQASRTTPTSTTDERRDALAAVTQGLHARS